MKYCHVEFEPKDQGSLSRTVELFDLMKVAKEADETSDDTQFVNYLTESERAYFWNPSPDELQEWNDEWFSTPVDIRLSPRMVSPQWHLESMFDAFWHGDYDLVGIEKENGRYYLAFNPHGYPYGGTGCMVAFLECFGHTVVGIDDGTGFEHYTPRTEFWKPKNREG